MKRFFSLICVILFAVAVSAKITWNAKGGFGIATNYGSDVMGTSPCFVWKLGGGIEYPLTSNISLMPSLEYAMKGAHADKDEKLTIHYLQVPVVGAYRINISDAWNITLKAGPYFAVNVYDKSSWSTRDGDDSVSNMARRFDTGLDFGVDFEHHRFVFGVEAELGFINLYKYEAIKNLAFYATVGWKF